MAITAIYGFEYFGTMLNTTQSSLVGFGKLPFITNNLNNGYSRFRFERYQGKVWLRSMPGTGDRRPVTSCHCSQWGGYLGQTCQRRTITQNNNATWDRRRIDSSRRTPTMAMTVRESFSEALDDESNRFFTMGFRLWLPSGIGGTSEILCLNTGTGDVSGGVLLFSNSDLLSSDLVSNTCYLEIQFDRLTGIYRRWVGERELPRQTLSSAYKSNFANRTIQFGRKSTSTAGSNQATITSRQYGPCPTPTNYPVDTGAPQNLNYAIADIYFLADKGSSDSTSPQRLGEIEIGEIEVNEFLLNRFWSPANNESPTETVRRTKNTNNVSSRQLTGDTHSDPGRAILGGGSVHLGEEILYAEIDVYGSRDNNGATTMKVKTKDGSQLLQERTLELPIDTLSTEKAQRQAFSLEKELGGPNINIEDLSLEITFQ